MIERVGDIQAAIGAKRHIFGLIELGIKRGSTVAAKPANLIATDPAPSYGNVIGEVGSPGTDATRQTVSFLESAKYSCPSGPIAIPSNRSLNAWIGDHWT